MAWRQIKVEQQRLQFINAYLEKKFSLSELCGQYDISRRCGYKWIRRYLEEGISGLKDRHKAPLHQAGATNPELVKKILEVKFRWPKWGPKKVLGYLKENHSHIFWPSSTTIGNLLNKHGLTEKRKLRKRLAERNDPLKDCNASNDLWCIDFKGWSLTHDQKKCDPFTLMDAHSRFLLCCVKLDMNDTEHVWAVFEPIFRQFGLPLRIRSDNGPPFASNGPGRLSRLSIKLIKAGIIPEWIDPGHPEQNGRHERMHLTLQQEAIDSSKDLEWQIAKLEEFANYYNFIRPHEALGQKSPGSIYQPSTRYWNGRLWSPEYPENYKIGKVKSCGKMSWNAREIYISRVFEGEPIGLVERGDGTMQAYYGPIMLGTITKEHILEFPRRKGRERRRVCNK
jgi:putative transposase